MNILIATWSLEVGGSELLCLHLANALAARGHAITIFNSHEDWVDNELLRRLEPTVSVCSMADWPILNFLAWKFNALARRLRLSLKIHDLVKARILAHVIRTRNIEIISSHSSYSDQIASAAAGLTAVPLVITEQGEYCMFIEANRLDMTETLNAADVVIAISDYCERTLAKHTHLKNEILTIYNGAVVKRSSSASETVRKRLGIGNNDVVFVFVARGIPEKGWELAIKAFVGLRAVVDKGVHLILAGGSAYVQELREFYGGFEGIHFVGVVADPSPYVEAADVGLMLSLIRTEALSVSAIEYVLLGKAVIATDVGGVREVLSYDNQLVGKLIPLDPSGSVNTPQVTEAMLDYANLETPTSTGPEVVQQAEQRFSMQRCAEKYEKLFHELVRSQTS